VRLRLPEPGHQPLPHVVKDYPRQQNKKLAFFKSQNKNLKLGEFNLGDLVGIFPKKKPQPVDVTFGPLFFFLSS
jgi:hypothetical protein